MLGCNLFLPVADNKLFASLVHINDELLRRAPLKRADVLHGKRYQVAASALNKFARVARL